MMDLNVKDVIGIVIYVATVVGLLADRKYHVKKVEDSNATIKKVIFQEKGGLNIVDNVTCKEHRDSVYTKIRHEAHATSRAFDNIDCLNQNIIKIMMHMKLKPIVFERKHKNND